MVAKCDHNVNVTKLEIVKKMNDGNEIMSKEILIDNTRNQYNKQQQ